MLFITIIPCCDFIWLQCIVERFKKYPWQYLVLSLIEIVEKLYSLNGMLYILTMTVLIFLEGNYIFDRFNKSHDLLLLQIIFDDFYKLYTKVNIFCFSFLSSRVVLPLTVEEVREVF